MAQNSPFPLFKVASKKNPSLTNTGQFLSAATNGIVGEQTVQPQAVQPPFTPQTQQTSQPSFIEQPNAGTFAQERPLAQPAIVGGNNQPINTQGTVTPNNPNGAVIQNNPNGAQQDPLAAQFNTPTKFNNGTGTGTPTETSFLGDITNSITSFMGGIGDSFLGMSGADQWGAVNGVVQSIMGGIYGKSVMDNAEESVQIQRDSLTQSQEEYDNKIAAGEASVNKSAERTA